jgi:hypothetical protein
LHEEEARYHFYYYSAMNLFSRLFHKETPIIAHSCDDDIMDVRVEYKVKNEIFTSTLQIPKAYIFHENNKRNLVINEVIEEIKRTKSLSFVRLRSIKPL